MCANIIEDLATLSSPEAQLKFQRDVPFVNISVELVYNWFDGSYFPNDAIFVALLSATEWKAVTEFSAIFDSVASEFSNEDFPEISELLQRPIWKRVIEVAKIALAAFQDK